MNHLHRALLYALAFLFIAGISSQAAASDKKITKKDVPATVLKAFKAAFPKVHINSYGKETEDNNTFYEFETVEGTIRRDILYRSDGTLEEVEELLAPTAIPAEIARAITADMPKAKILGGEKTTKGTSVTYDVNVKIGGKTGTVNLNADGTIIKKAWMNVKKEKKEEQEEGEKEEKDAK